MCSTSIGHLAGETTSQRVARLAAIGAKTPERLTLEEIQSVCGSALTQAPDHTPKNALLEAMSANYFERIRPNSLLSDMLIEGDFKL